MGTTSKAKTETKTTSNQFSLDAKDNSGIAVVSGGAVTINMSDQGSIAKAFNFASDQADLSFELAGDSLMFANASLTSVLDWSKTQSDLAFGATDKAMDYTKQAYESFIEKDRTEQAQSLDKLTKYLFMSVVAIAGMMYWSKRA